MKTLTTLLAIAVIGIAGSAQAGSINEREAAQRTSIRNGFEDGSLTGAEARRLRNQQVRLERKEQYFKADGELTARERAGLRRDLDANRVSIYRQRHDDQTRNQ